MASRLNTRDTDFERTLELQNLVYFQDYMGKQQRNWNQLYETKKITGSTWHWVKTHGLGLMPTKEEGAPVSQDSYGTSYKVEMKPAAYALGLAITHEGMNDAFGDMAQKKSFEDRNADFMGMLAESAAETQMIRAMDLFNFGDTAQGQQVDGKPFFSTNHELANGSTYSNQGTAAMPISTDAMEMIHIELGSYRNDRNFRNAGGIGKILYPHNLQFDVVVTLNSVAQPSTANNDINALRQELSGITRIETHYLDSANSWFVFNAQAMEGLVYVEREGMQHRSEQLNQVYAYYMNCYIRYVFGGFYPKAAYQVPGA